MTAAGQQARETAEGGVPEADRLGAFPHPRTVAEFFGHEAAERTLLDSFKARRLHHAWLLAGPEGVGKATLAYRFARFLLAHGDEEDTAARDLSIPASHPVFHRVAALSHPNLLVLRRTWVVDRKRFANAITVSEARRLRPFFGHTAGDGLWRAVVIDRAEELNAAAANALLKNLEEPPARCVFLLVCSSPGRLPVTIRSRCRTLRLGPLEDGELEQTVQNAFHAAALDPPPVERLRAAMPLAEGSVGRALRLLELGGSELHIRLLALMERLPTLDYGAIHALADELTAAGADEAYELFFGLVQDAIARIAGHAATGSGAWGPEAALAERLQDNRALAQWASLWETVRRAKADADALNLDRKNLVLGTFFKLEETARQAMR